MSKVNSSFAGSSVLSSVQFADALEEIDAALTRAEDVKRADPNVRGNLPGFEVNEEIKQTVNEAILMFETGDHAVGSSKIRNAMRHLGNSQDAYARNGLFRKLEERFVCMTKTPGVAESETELVRTALEAYEKALGHNHRNPTEISRLAWAAEDAFAEARKQHDQRMTDLELNARSRVQGIAARLKGLCKARK